MSEEGTDDLLLTQHEVRAIDAAAVAELGITGMLLMENAARGVADTIRRRFADAGEILILCGSGNNGGDGLALARQLAAADTSAKVFLMSAADNLMADAESNLRILMASKLPVNLNSSFLYVTSAVRALKPDDLIVDCLLGTGVRGAVRSPMDQVIQSINQSQARVLAVDVPSGLNCDDGKVVNACVKADATVTFVAEKRGFRNPEARAYTGDVVVAHIGLPTRWVRSWVTMRRELNKDA